MWRTYGWCPPTVETERAGAPGRRGKCVTKDERHKRAANKVSQARKARNRINTHHDYKQRPGEHDITRRAPQRPGRRTYYATWGMAAAPAAELLGSGGAWALGLLAPGPVGGLGLTRSARGQQLLRLLRLVRGRGMLRGKRQGKGHATGRGQAETGDRQTGRGGVWARGWSGGAGLGSSRRPRPRMRSGRPTAATRSTPANTARVEVSRCAWWAGGLMG